MNPLQIIATLRKFGNYLAGLFPFLAVMADRMSEVLRGAAATPALAGPLKRVAESVFFVSIWKIVERFYWRDYKKNRLDLSQSPPECLPVLRPVFQMAALLCVLIPLTGLGSMRVPIETLSGFTGDVPSWAVILWLIFLPMGWACLLSGTAVSNRSFFVPVATGGLYFVSSCVLDLPRSAGNAFLPAAVLLNLLFCLRSRESLTGKTRFYDWLTAILAGAPCGIALTALTPLRPFLATVLPLDGPAISLGLGSLLGAVLGAVCLGISRHPRLASFGPTSIGAVTWTSFSLILVFLTFALSRGDLGHLGGSIISSLDLSNGYLWPIFYFIGIGIMHKLVSSTRVIASSTRGLLPSWLLVPFLTILLVLATAVSFSERICFFASYRKGPVWEAIFSAFHPLYIATRESIWLVPLTTMSVHWFSWVLLFTLAVASGLAIQKRLTGEAVSRLFFMVCLAALLIWEYVFQLSSFARTPSHSVIVLTLFALWLLWLMHTIGWSMSLSSSPMWPAAGRLATYAGILSLVMLEINAKAASGDFRITNQLFLTMFRGVIDVGLPYYFLIWASRRMKDLTIETATIFKAFVAGSLFSFLFNLLDKFAACGFSIQALLQLLARQSQGWQSSGNLELDLVLPDLWFVIRAMLYAGLLLVVMLEAEKRFAGSKDARHSIIFTLLAFASGIIAFSSTFVELPLPNEIRVALAPVRQALSFDCNVLVVYLAFWIPALLLAIVRFLTGKRRHLMGAWILIVVLNAIIAWSYQTFEVLMRASGTLYAAVTAVAAMFAVLVIIALDILDGPEPPEAIEKGPLLSRPALALVIMCMALATLLQAAGGLDLEMTMRKVPVLEETPLFLSKRWQMKEELPGRPLPANPTILLTRPGEGSLTLLQITSLAPDPHGPAHHLEALVKAALDSGSLPGLKLNNVESWNRHYPGAVACYFSYELPAGKNVMTMSGLSVLLPSVKGRTVVFSLYTSPSTLEKERWELAATVERLSPGR